MERYRLTADAAFALLAEISQDTNTKLRDVAAELCWTGTLPRIRLGAEPSAPARYPAATLRTAS
jgi:hypothetical protein